MPKTAPEEERILRVETRRLATKLTLDELRDRGDELARTVQEVTGEEETQKNLKDQMKARLSELQARQTRLALVVSRREELRDVEVISRLTADGMVREIRKDTGEEVTIRPMREDERQLNMAKIKE